MTPNPFTFDYTGSTNDLAALEQQAKKNEAVVVICPYSTGCCVALELQLRGYRLICVWPQGFSEAMKTHEPVSCQGLLKYDITVEEADTITDTAAMVTDMAKRYHWTIAACVCGGEAGVDLTDALSEELGLLSNGTSVANRRDKKVQQELAKEAGLRSVRQAAGKCLSDVEPFLKTEKYPLIIKPLDSAGSDGVKLCRSFEEAAAHVQALLGSPMVNGGFCEELLCQEYLQGREYVVDNVSRDGVHKVVMVWVYDKRPANGGDFVYYGDIPVDPGSPEAKLLIPYAQKLLDAIGVRNGPSHGEIIITEDGQPCLVEMNCRCHGGDGNWRPLCKAMTGGYDQVDAAVLSYVDEKEFLKLPDIPPSPLLASGQCVDLVSYMDGTVKETPGYDLIRNLPSFVCLETHIKQGSKVKKTVDISTDAGSLVVVNHDQAALARDIQIIRLIEEANAMFVFYPPEEVEWVERRQQMMAKAKSLDWRQQEKPALGSRAHKQHRRVISQDLTAWPSNLVHQHSFIGQA